MTLKCGLEVTQALKVIEAGAIQKLGCGFLSHSIVTRRNFVKMFDADKTRMIRLPYAEKTMTIC